MVVHNYSEFINENLWDKEFEDIDIYLQGMKDLGFEVEKQNRHNVKGTWHEIMPPDSFIYCFLDPSVLKNKESVASSVVGILKEKYLSVTCYTRSYTNMDKRLLKLEVEELVDRLSDKYDVFHYIYIDPRIDTSIEGGNDGFFNISLDVFEKNKYSSDLLKFRSDIDFAFYQGGGESRKW